jgi:subtilase family serine protease
VVTCSGGTLQNGGTAHITINTNAPTVDGLYTNTATVDPNNAIAERNENNNTMSTNVYVSWLN